MRMRGMTLSPVAASNFTFSLPLSNPIQSTPCNYPISPQSKPETLAIGPLRPVSPANMAIATSTRQSAPRGGRHVITTGLYLRSQVTAAAYRPGGTNIKCTPAILKRESPCHPKYWTILIFSGQDFPPLNSPLPQPTTTTTTHKKP